MSSMLAVEALETQRSPPERAAPSAVATPAAGWTRPWLPIGVTMIGCGSVVPSRLTEVSIWSRTTPPIRFGVKT